MAWLDLVVIGSILLIAGALIGARRRRGRYLYTLGLPGGPMASAHGDNETAPAVARPDTLAPQHLVKEADPAGARPHGYFLDALEKERQRSIASGQEFSLIIIALDKFKQLNDRMGRLEADKALTAAAALLVARSRPPQVVARYGPDEFAILMPETDARQAAIRAEELRAAVEAERFLRAREVTGSFAFATFSDHGLRLAEILRIADWGICLARRCGGNCVKAALSAKPEDAERDQRLLQACLAAAAQETLTNSAGTSIHAPHKLQPMNPLFHTISALAFAVGAKGPDTNDHSQAVSTLATRIAIEAGLSQAEIEEIRLAGLVHDIGKLSVPEHVLKKPSLLTAEEFEIMKSHPACGAQMLEPLQVKAIARIVRHHHERYDGKGYPEGLAGDSIPLGARIVAVAECFHNMLSDLRYKNPRSFQDALAELRRCSGTQFDPQVVTGLLEWIQIHAHPSDP